MLKVLYIVVGIKGYFPGGTNVSDSLTCTGHRGRGNNITTDGDG